MMRTLSTLPSGILQPRQGRHDRSPGREPGVTTRAGVATASSKPSASRLWRDAEGLDEVGSGRLFRFPTACAVGYGYAAPHGAERRGLACCGRLLALVLISSLASAAGPALARLEPPGAQRGTAVRLELVGAGLDGELKVHSQVPGAITPLTPEGPGMRRRPYLLEVSPEAPVGAYPIRVETEEGVSNVLLFAVGSFPETVEEESEFEEHIPLNDSAGSAQGITLPVTVNATLSGPDKDVYRVDAKAGQRLDIEVESSRIGSAVDPILEVRDAGGRTLARNNDARGIGTDARISFTAEGAGPLFVSVHDASFKAQGRNHYRLKVGQFQYAELAFPLSGRRGEATQVELSGGSLAEPQTVSISGDGDWAALQPKGEHVSSPVRFPLTREAHVLESEGSTLEPEVIVDGRIAQAGEHDSYTLGVKAGESWLIQARAAATGFSDLYALLTLRDQSGKKLGSAGDQEPDEPLSNLRVNNDLPGDPYLLIDIPEGVEELQISIEDLLGRGGDGYGYQLSARQQPADFTLTMLTPYINVPLRGSSTITVNLDRRGYMGKVDLEVEGAPEDVVVTGGHIAAEFGGMTTARESRRGLLTLSPKPGAKLGPMELQVYGVAVNDKGEKIRRKAEYAEAMAATYGGLTGRVAEEEAAVLEVVSPRHVRLIQGMTHDIQFAFSGRRPGVRPTDVVSVTNTPSVGNLRIIGGGKIKKGDTKGVFHLNTTMGTPAMTFDLPLTADTMVAGRKQTIVSPAIVFEVVQGYEVDPPAGPVTIEPGKEALISGQFRREPDFNSPVTIKASNLPNGVTCSEAVLSGEASRYKLECSAEKDASAGEYAVELAATSYLAARDTEEVPYNIPPVEAELRIGGARMAGSR